MVAITRPGSGGYGTRLTSSFSGKTPSTSGSGTHPVGLITRSGSAGYGVRRTGSFSGKMESNTGIALWWPFRKARR